MCRPKNKTNTKHYYNFSIEAYELLKKKNFKSV